MRSRQPFRRIATRLLPRELSRVRSAAARREMSVPEFLRQAAVAIADSTLSSTRFELNPHERRAVDSFPAPRR